MGKQWFNKTVEEVEKELGTNKENGLSSKKVEENRAKYGLNELKEKKKESLIQKFIDQFKDFSIIVLIIAAIVSGVVGVMQGEGFTDTIIILIVVLLNAVIGVAQESKAEKSLEALKKLSAHAAKVIRNGKETAIPARELVPGDLVIIETGDYISADLRVIEAVNLKSQEASLTGESVPVEKRTDAIQETEVGVGDRKNMLFSSSLITYGRGKAIVVKTGMNTEVGKIADMINQTEDQETPLQKKLNSLGKTLGMVALTICAVIFVIGLLQGKEIINMFMTAVSLAVAVIPEGLVAVSTIVLAIGVQKMVKKNAIVKKLPAVETLGSSTVICSDKTGTLTQNKMTVEKVFCNDTTSDIERAETNEDFRKLIYDCMLCNDSRVLENGEIAGDPTETALVDFALKLDYPVSIMRENPRVAEVPFDSNRKLMSTVNGKDGKYIVYTKGGLDEILRKCDSYLYKGSVRHNLSDYAEWIRTNNEHMANEALRVLAFAYKEIDHVPSKYEMENLESGLTFIGMVGMIDPPREEAKKAVEKCKHAGIKTVMITGDHKATAVAIAKKIGILENDNEALTGLELDKISDEQLAKDVRKYSVYARVSPEHKVRIVKAWQKNGEIVAMTGDGVNDVLALKESDCGIAMANGSEATKAVAQLVLLNSDFGSLPKVVAEGRKQIHNLETVAELFLSKTIFFVCLALMISIIRLPYPLLPIQSSLVGSCAIGIPALFLALLPAKERVEKGFLKRILITSVPNGIIMMAFVLLGYIITYMSGAGIEYSRSVALLTFMGISLLILVRVSAPLTKFKFTLVCTMIAFCAACYVIPIGRNLFSLVKISIQHWLLVLILVLIAGALIFIRGLIVKKHYFNKKKN